MKPWYWEMERAGWGPHHYLSLEFAPQNAPLLHQILLDTPPQGFHPEPREEGQQYSWGDWPLANNTLLWGKEGNYQWGFAFARLTGPLLGLEHGWRFQSDEDSLWLHQILSGSLLSLRNWQISAGGDGYNPTFCRSGQNASRLLSYMEGETSKPDWTFIENELQRALRQYDLGGKFTLSKCSLSEGSEILTATLLYKVPRDVDGHGWLTEPEWQELIGVAREVGNICDIPYTASSASVHAPNDWNQIIGGSIEFGIRSQS